MHTRPGPIGERDSVPRICTIDRRLNITPGGNQMGHPCFSPSRHFHSDPALDVHVQGQGRRAHGHETVPGRFQWQEGASGGGRACRGAGPTRGSLATTGANKLGTKGSDGKHPEHPGAGISLPAKALRTGRRMDGRPLSQGEGYLSLVRNLSFICLPTAGSPTGFPFPCLAPKVGRSRNGGHAR